MNCLKKPDTWKIKLTIAINCISFKDTDEEGIIHSQSDKKEIMIYDKTDEVIQELFASPLSRYQTGLEELMKNSGFIFDCAILFHCKCHKINLNRGGSYIDSPDRIKKQKSNNKSYQ